jgi:DNA-binding transcriptional regulator YiaG
MTAAQFKKRRQKLWQSQYAAADALGVTRGAVGHWEDGRRPIPKTIVILLDCLERKLEDSLSVP